jgi:hypothetical protein
LTAFRPNIYSHHKKWVEGKVTSSISYRCLTCKYLSKQILVQDIGKLNKLHHQISGLRWWNISKRIFFT